MLPHCHLPMPSTCRQYAWWCRYHPVPPIRMVCSAPANPLQRQYHRSNCLSSLTSRRIFFAPTSDRRFTSPCADAVADALPAPRQCGQKVSWPIKTDQPDRSIRSTSPCGSPGSSPENGPDGYHPHPRESQATDAVRCYVCPVRYHVAMTAS